MGLYITAVSPASDQHLAFSFTLPGLQGESHVLAVSTGSAAVTGRASETPAEEGGGGGTALGGCKEQNQ